MDQADVLWYSVLGAIFVGLIVFFCWWASVLFDCDRKGGVIVKVQTLGWTKYECVKLRQVD
jgi:hypothetical protein